MLAFEREYLRFREEGITFFEYAQSLVSHATALGIDLYAFPNLSLYQEVDTREDRIDFDLLENEINQYLGALFASLDAAGAEEDAARMKR